MHIDNLTHIGTMNVLYAAGYYWQLAFCMYGPNWPALRKIGTQKTKSLIRQNILEELMWIYKGYKVCTE